MGKRKSMGIEYKIATEGTWEQVTEIVRATKESIVNTKPKASLFSLGNSGLEDSILKVYLTPQEEESFVDYRTRFIQNFTGTGVKSKLASLLLGKKIPFNFYLTQNGGESTLRVNSITREDKYQVTISASGFYTQRGESIATSVKELLEQDDVLHTYTALDKLI